MILTVNVFTCTKKKSEMARIGKEVTKDLTLIYLCYHGNNI